MPCCDCAFEVKNAEQRRVLIALLLINAAMFAVEIVVGLIAESTGVLADSLDMFADAMVYGISLYAIGRAAGIKARAARLSGYGQIAIALGVLGDIVRRTAFGSEPQSWLMFIVSLVALAANSACLWLIARHRDGEVHMRASWIFSKNDVLANLGVIIASGLVYLSGSRWPDLVIGLIITAVVMRGGFAILQEARVATGSADGPDTSTTATALRE